MNLEDAIAYLLSRMPPEVTDEMKLDLLERLVWYLDDNGTELFRLREAWLSSSDDGFVALALMPWSGLIGSDRAEAEALLAPLMSRREYQGRIEERLAEHEGGPNW